MAGFADAFYGARVSDSPQAPSPRGTTPWLAGLCIAGAIALTVFALNRSTSPPAPEDRCGPAPSTDDVVRAFDGWNETDTGVRMVVQRDVEAWLTRWHTARAQVCAKRSSSPPDPTDLAGANPTAADPTALADPTRWLTCLERQRLRATTMLHALATAEASTRAHAWKTTFALPPTEDCAVARTTSPIDPQRAEDLDLAEAAWVSGHTDQAKALLDAIELADEDPLAPRVLWLQARLAQRRGDPSTPLLQRALWEAVAFDRPALVTDIALALALETQDDLAAAQQWWGLASASARRLPSTSGRQHALMHAQARLLHAAGQPKAALSLYEVALTLIERERSGQHPAMIEDLVASAHAAISLGELDAAERLTQRALDVADGSLGARHETARSLLREVASALVDAGAGERAAGWLRILHERQDEDARGQTWLARGRAHLAAGQPTQARDAFHAASLWATTHDAQAELRVQIELGMAAVAQARGESDIAVDHLAKAIESIDDPNARIRVQLQRASLQAEAGALEDAATTIREALAAVPDNDHAAAGDVLSAAADLALRSDRPAEALDLARRAVASCVRGRGPADASVVVALGHLGTACLALNRDDEAVITFERAADVAAAANMDPPARAAMELAWASALWRTKERDEAARVAGQAFTRVAKTPDAAAFASWFVQRGLQPPPSE